MKKYIFIAIYFFILYILPFIATDIVYNFTNGDKMQALYRAICTIDNIDKYMLLELYYVY